MNYCEKIKYHIYFTKQEEFELMAAKLLARLPKDESILRLIFFGNPSDNEVYIDRSEKLSKRIQEIFPCSQPVVSYVSQPTLNNGLTLEVHSYKADDTDKVSYHVHNGFPYVIVNNAAGRFLFAGGFHGNISLFTIEQQSVEVFRQICEVLHKERFPIESIIRQWNYIERITDFDGYDQHYQMFNNVRSNFNSQTTWDNGYPAATGIGTNLGGVLVDIDAAVFCQSECFATPIDNTLQVAAHAYSSEVLEVAQEQKTTPKFERAKSMTFNGKSLIYISGTAAIRGEKSLNGVGFKRQLQITMENIYELIADAELKMLRVYLKDKTDYDEAKTLLETYKLNIPISYMVADVCRDELLIEIEGIAMQGIKG